MGIELSPLLDRFAERTPLPVLARAVLERCLNPPILDDGFAEVAEAQSTRHLLFSTLLALMSHVVLRQQPSIHAVYRAVVGEITVSVTSVYNQLNGLEASTSAALVAFSGARAAELIAELDGARPPLLAGMPVKVLDGNALAGREHRLVETRGPSAAPLPGKALAVFDPALEVVTALYLSLRGRLHPGTRLVGSGPGGHRPASGGLRTAISAPPAF
jgi:hypothetical protein